jgi:hypothetical protein
MTDVGFTLGQNEPRNADTRAGMFLYTAAQRRQAADFLHTTLYDMIQGQAPHTAWLVDAADDIANQVTNCFASDLCTPGDWSFAGKTGADSDDWRTTGDGVTVSPDDLLKWNGAASGGPYGDSERLLYRDGSSTPVTQWAASAGTGALVGTVRRDDLAQSPVVGATVGLLGITVTTGADGRFDLGPIPAGEYPLTVTATVNGTPLEQTEVVTVAVGQTTDVALVLRGPRLITIAGSTRVLDGETTYNVVRRHLTTERLQVSAGERIEEKQWRTPCVDDETDMVLEYRAEWLTGQNVVPGTIQVTVRANLYEETVCKTSEREDSDTKVVVLAPNEQAEVVLNVDNADLSTAPDEGSAHLIIVNGAYFHSGEPETKVRVAGNLHILDHDTFGQNDIADQPFDLELTLSPNQRAQMITEQQKRADQVLGEFQTMAVLQANNRDLRVFTIEHQTDEGAVSFGCDTHGGWADDVPHGVATALVKEVSRCDNYVKTTFTVTHPAP